MSWEFKLESKDIGFGVTFVMERDSGETETIDVAKYTKLYAGGLFRSTC